MLVLYLTIDGQMASFPEHFLHCNMSRILFYTEDIYNYWQIQSIYKPMVCKWNIRIQLVSLPEHFLHCHMSRILFYTENTDKYNPYGNQWNIKIQMVSLPEHCLTLSHVTNSFLYWRNLQSLTNTSHMQSNGMHVKYKNSLWLAKL